jgi:Killing trait
MANSFDESVSFINGTVLSPTTIQAESMGKAVQAMSHSLALALQDATDNQRNFEAVNSAALTKATQELIATKDVATWSPIITALQTAQATQEANFAKLSTDIEGLLKNLPMPTGGQ